MISRIFCAFSIFQALVVRTGKDSILTPFAAAYNRHFNVVGKFANCACFDFNSSHFAKYYSLAESTYTKTQILALKSISRYLTLTLLIFCFYLFLNVDVYDTGQRPPRSIPRPEIHAWLSRTSKHCPLLVS